ncbi:MAG: cupin domain-containing protein [Actinomycetota bacterium]
MSPAPISLTDRFAALDLLPNRTPDLEDRVTEDAGPRWLDTLGTYRDGGIFIVHYSGDSAWERHVADEVVMVIDGETTMTLVIDGAATEVLMTSMQMVVVPADTWHRFHTPDRVQVMTITPQPTEHRLDDPTTSG